MLNIDIYLKGLNELNTAGTIKAGKNKNIGDSFYSVLIKHQLEMTRVWSSSNEKFEMNIDPFSISKSLLQINGFGNNIKTHSITPNTQHALNSYETAKNIDNSNVFNKSSLKELSAKAAINNSIPTKLFQKLIHLESGFNSQALSSRGAMGLGQIMPETAKELGLSLENKETPGSVWHAESNLDASARYLRKLYDKYQNKGISKDESWSFAAGAYNAGMGNIAKAIKKVSHEQLITWDQVAQVLPQVTGRHSQETISYVKRLRA